MASQSIQVGQLRCDVIGNRPAANAVAAGTWFYATDTGAMYQNVLDAGGSRVWVIPGGSTTGSWSKYVVSPASGGGVTQPTALYNTITDAVNAAVADGHNDANPATILLLPGTHVFTGALPAGINLCGLVSPVGAQDIESNVVVSGTITLSAAGTNGNQLSNLEVSGHVVVNGATTRASLNGITVISGTANPCLDVTGVAVNLYATDCGFNQQNGVDPAVRFNTQSFGQFLRCTLANSTNLYAFDQNVGPAALTIDFIDCSIVGLVRTGASVHRILRCDLLATASPAVSAIATATVELDGCQYSASVSPAFDGAGTIKLGTNIPALFSDRNTGMTQTSLGTVRNMSWSTLAGGEVLTSQTSELHRMVGDGTSTPKYVTLPSASAFTTGRSLTFTNDEPSGRAFFVLVCAGSDTIGGTAVQYLLTPGSSVRIAVEAAGTWEVIGERIVPASNLDVYVATTGSDNNAGTDATHAFATIDAALSAVGRIGWAGYCHINCGAGTFTLSSAKVQVPGSFGVGAEAVALIGTMNDSGLGTRTIAASTTGSGSTFGTVQDSVGGLTVDAYKGYYLRLTGAGANVGKRFLIAANTANTFTVCGLFVAVTTETFVVEAPGTVIRYALAGTVRTFHTTGAPLVLQNVQLDGQGSSSIMIVHNVLVVSAVNVTDISSRLEVSDGGVLQSQPTFLFNNYAPSVAPLASVGMYLTSTVGSVGASEIQVGGSTTGAVSLSNSLLRQRVRMLTSGAYLGTSNWHENVGAVLSNQAGLINISSCRFETVTSQVGIYTVATIAFEDGSSGQVLSTNINGSTSSSLTIATTSVAIIQTLTGTGNAGVPVTIVRGSGLGKSSGNTITGAVAGQDVQVGSTAAPTAWAAINGGVVYDNAALGTNQFCYATQ